CRVPVAEEGVLGAAEPLPQLVLELAGSRAGSLPVPHQVPVATRGRAPVGALGEGLCLRDEALLHGTGGVALLVLLGEVCLAVSGVGRPGGGEPPPQRVVGGLVQAR